MTERADIWEGGESDLGLCVFESDDDRRETNPISSEENRNEVDCSPSGNGTGESSPCTSATPIGSRPLVRSRTAKDRKEFSFAEILELYKMHMIHNQRRRESE